MQKNTRKEALLNEYKGNLFEFLVAKSIAMHFGMESQFLQEISENNLNILNQQEELLRHHAMDWLKFLPEHSMITADKIITDLEIKDLNSVHVIGKVNASVGQAETDIILTSKNEKLDLSLKLCKNHSFVNTKSAGIRTIFSKYFTSIKGEEIQLEFNDFVDLEFDIFARRIHQLADIEYLGSFDQWEKSGLPVLPGDLKNEFHVELLNYYEKINQKIYTFFLNLYDNELEVFRKGVLSLMGYSKNNIIQVSSYYKKTKDILKSENILISRAPDLKEEPNMKCSKSSMEIYFKNIVLQIRLKPMNKFTQKAYKINCSIKPLF